MALKYNYIDNLPHRQGTSNIAQSNLATSVGSITFKSANVWVIYSTSGPMIKCFFCMILKMISSI